MVTTCLTPVLGSTFTNQHVRRRLTRIQGYNTTKQIGNNSLNGYLPRIHQLRPSQPPSWTWLSSTSSTKCTTTANLCHIICANFRRNSNNTNRYQLTVITELTRGTNFVVPPVCLPVVSRPFELSLQSSLQLSLTVLVCYRSRCDI